MAGHTPQFGGFDREVHRRQGGAHQGHSHMLASGHILGPANDLERLPRSGRPHIHPANAEAVGVGVGIAAQHPAHHHTSRLSGQVVDRLHLESRHRQALRQSLWG